MNIVKNNSDTVGVLRAATQHWWTARRSVVPFAVYAVTILATWILGVTVNSAAGVFSALLATSGLVVAVQLGWRQGRARRIGFVSLQIVAPTLVGLLVSIEATLENAALQWPTKVGFLIGLLAAVMSAAVIRAAVFRWRPQIFLSYRRAESAYVVDRLYEKLVRRYGRDHVFHDVQSLYPGQDFRQRISSVIRRCDMLLVIIGPDWSDIRDDAGRRRLEQHDDYVRNELELAFGSDVGVVPVLIDNARLPDAHDLPVSLRQLPHLAAVQLRPGPDFHNDIQSLMTRLELAQDDIIEERSQRGRPLARRLSSVVSLALVFVVITQILVVAAIDRAWGRTDIYLSPDGRYVVSTHVDHESSVLRLWRADDGHLEEEVALRGIKLADVSWSPDSRQIVTGSTDGSIQVRNVAGLTPGRHLRNNFGVVNGFAWSPTGGKVSAIDASDTVRVWDTSTGREIAKMSNFNFKYGELSWSPDGDRIAVSGVLTALTVLALRRDELEVAWQDEVRLSDVSASAYDAEWSIDGSKLAVTNYSAPYLLVFKRDGEPPDRIPFEGITGFAESLFWSPDGSMLAGLEDSYQNGVWIWDARTQELRHSFTTGDPTEFLGGDRNLAWSPAGTQLVTGLDGQFKIFSIGDGSFEDLPSPSGDGVLTRWHATGIEITSSPQYGNFFQLWRIDEKGRSRVDSTFSMTPWRGLVAWGVLAGLSSSGE